MDLQDQIVNLDNSDLSVPLRRLTEFRSHDRKRGSILNILEDDWPAARLVIGRLMPLMENLSPKKSQACFNEILTHALSRYELTVTVKPQSSQAPLRFRDGFRFAVFLEGIVSGVESSLDLELQEAGIRAQETKKKGAKKKGSDGRVRQALYQQFAPEAMRQYFQELGYEDGIVGGRLDFSSGGAANLHTGT